MYDRKAEAQRYARERERSYSRMTSPAEVSDDDENPYCKRVCPCGKIHLGLRQPNTSLCFDCTHVNNPFAGKSVRMSVDATGEDSTNPSRIADGTHIYNVGLPPVETGYGPRDAYGQRKVVARPVANNELSSARKLREAAKRAGLTPLSTQKRAVGGR